MTYAVRQTPCPECEGTGVVGFTTSVRGERYGEPGSRHCEDCNGTGETDASCLWCERIVPIDEEGMCAHCAAPAIVDATLTEVHSDPFLKSGRVTMTDIRIRKIDIDDLLCDKPPTWGKIKAVVNGAEVQLTLDESRIGQLLAFATPLAMELIDQIVNAPKAVVEINRQCEPAA